MPMTINGSGTITGLVAGGLPDATVTQPELATGVAGTGPAFSAYASSAQTIATGTWTKILFDTEDFDTNSNFASSRFTPTVAGYYQFSSNCEWATSNTTTGVGAFGMYKNGSPYRRGNQFSLAAINNTGYQLSLVVYLNGTTDYVEIYMFQGSAGNLTTQNVDNGDAVWFTGAMVRSAT